MPVKDHIFHIRTLKFCNLHQVCLMSSHLIQQNVAGLLHLLLFVCRVYCVCSVDNSWESVTDERLIFIYNTCEKSKILDNSWTTKNLVRLPNKCLYFINTHIFQKIQQNLRLTKIQKNSKSANQSCECIFSFRDVRLYFKTIIIHSLVVSC